ncbi:hypothetical protein GCM10023231_29180 [Olivibacter ginsenosidimutans]|uniref:F5/8 type C domain-containing protein n=2 Tax=Olivibacter ginsenosidimutans TaxID=1176537 RepID=A0ABP9BTV8_9SPHI
MACDKSKPYEELSNDKDGAMVFIAKANNDMQQLTMFPYEKRTLKFNVGFGALGLPAEDIHISMSEDMHAFDSLNTIRQANGEAAYVKFPSAAYAIDQLNFTIPKGSVSSDYATLSYDPETFDPEKDHLLALSITDASGYTISPAAKTLLIVAPKLEERAADTKGWIATASTEQLSGENTGLASAVLDGDLNTIWHSRYSGGTRSSYPHWLSIDMLKSTYVTKIAMAPRQNNANGFTKFKLEGSTDGKTWFTLGDNLSFDPANKAYQSYEIEPQYLRNIKITMLEGLQDLTFLAEFVVYTY